MLGMPPRRSYNSTCCTRLAGNTSCQTALVFRVIARPQTALVFPRDIVARQRFFFLLMIPTNLKNDERRCPRSEADDLLDCYDCHIVGCWRSRLQMTRVDCLLHLSCSREHTTYVCTVDLWRVELIWQESSCIGELGE